MEAAGSFIYCATYQTQPVAFQLLVNECKLKFMRSFFIIKIVKICVCHVFFIHYSHTDFLLHLILARRPRCMLISFCYTPGDEITLGETHISTVLLLLIQTSFTFLLKCIPKNLFWMLLSSRAAFFWRQFSPSLVIMIYPSLKNAFSSCAFCDCQCCGAVHRIDKGAWLLTVQRCQLWPVADSPLRYWFPFLLDLLRVSVRKNAVICPVFFLHLWI